MFNNRNVCAVVLVPEKLCLIEENIVKVVEKGLKMNIKQMNIKVAEKYKECSRIVNWKIAEK